MYLMIWLFSIFFIFRAFSEDLEGDPIAQLPYFNEGIQAALESPTKFCSIPSVKDKEYSFPIYKREEVKGIPYAIFCWHANKKLLRVGHSATTFFLVDQKNSTPNKLMSQKRISVSSWPVRNTVSWKGEEEKTFLHFNGSADYIGHFVDKSEDEAETLCVPISKEEGEKLANYLFESKDKMWKLSTNCNDFSRNLFAVIGIHVETDRFSKSLCETPKRKNIFSTANHVMKGMKEAKEKMVIDTKTQFEFKIATEEIEAVKAKAKTK